MIFNNPSEFVEELKKEQKSNSFNRGFDPLSNVRRFHNLQPFFYDKNKIFWMWEKTTSKYLMVDETDIMNQIEGELGLYGQTINSRIKAEYMEAFRRIGRQKIPKPISKWWIQFKKSIIDIETNQTFEATPDFFFTNSIPWDIGQSEETPKIAQYLREWVVKEGLQDESYIQTMFEIIAYCCLNNQFLQTLFALTGSGSNGKGTFRDILKKFIGEENYSSSEMKLLTTKQFETSAIYRKSICAIPEVDSYDMRNTTRIKQLTGEDPIRYEFKGKTPFTEQSITKILVLTNSLPVTEDRSIGFYRRWLTIDFPHSFPVGKDVLADIPDIEYENLARKSINLLVDLKKRENFTNGGNFEDRKERYESRSNPIEKFLNENCILEAGTIPIPAMEFYKEANKFLKKHNMREMKNCQIKKQLIDLEIEIGRKSKREGGDVITQSGIWIQWKDDNEEQTVL